jgi:hypothetical protein
MNWKQSLTLGLISSVLALCVMATPIARGGILYHDANVTLAFDWNRINNDPWRHQGYVSVSTNKGTVDWFNIQYSPNYVYDEELDIWVPDPRRGTFYVNFNGPRIEPTASEDWHGFELRVTKPEYTLVESIGTGIYQQENNGVFDFVTGGDGNIVGTFKQNGTIRGAYEDYFEYETGAPRWFANVDFPVIFPEGSNVIAHSVGVPEPTALSLVPLTAAALLRRRRAA